MTRRNRLSALAVAIVLGVIPAAGSSAAAEPVDVRTARMGPATAMSNPIPRGPVPVAHDDCPLCRRTPPPEADGAPIPEDPRVAPGKMVPKGPPTEVLFDAGIVTAGAQRAPNDFSVYRSFTFPKTVEMGCNMRGWLSGYVNEPTLAVAGRTVLWAGNRYAAVSGDYGRTFTYFNPGDQWPRDGIWDVVGGATMCCDQVIYHDRKTGAWFWLILYYRPAGEGGNVQRIAVARSQRDVQEDNWLVYDFTPASFGYPATGYWLDFPYLTVSDNYLYHVTKLLSIEPESPWPTRTLVARYPLTEMASGQGFTFSWFVAGDVHGMRGTHGATSKMYFGAHVTTGTIRIYEWPESGSLNFIDRSHEGFNRGWPSENSSMSAPGPDGRNWAGWSDNWIWGAWTANNVIGFMVPSRQGGGYPYPHVQVMRFRATDRVFLNQQAIWNPNLGFLYPSVHPNDRGHLAGNICFGGPSQHPGVAAWIADDVNGGGFQPLEVHNFVAGTAGPRDAPRWGDYVTTCRNVPYGNTWGGSGYALFGDGGDSSAVAVYQWFGRERDRPPVHHVVYVDRLNTSGREDGTALHPYNTVDEGHYACVPGDTLVIRAGSYPEVVDLGTPITVRNENGTAAIGR
jgi:hypothetical protein